MNHSFTTIQKMRRAILLVGLLSAVAFNKTEAQVYNDGVLFIGSGCNVNLAGSMTNSSTANIYVDGVLNFNSNSVTFKSNATGTGILNKVGGTVENYDNVTVERYIPARRAFRFLAPAVNTSTSILNNWQEGSNVTGPNNYPNAGGTSTNPFSGFGTHITGSTTGANGFDATHTGDPSLYTYNSATQTWNAVANTNVNTINAGTAYRILVRGDRSVALTTNTPTPTNTVIRATGRLVIGDTTYTDNSSAADAYLFAANPYQCPVTLDMANATNLGNSISYWDPTLGTRGAYVTYNLALMISGNGSSGISEVLQPGQGLFFQKVTSAFASYAFKESDKVSGIVNNVYKNNNTLPKLGLRLYQRDTLLNGGPTADAFAVVFDAAFSNGIDGNDSKKLNNLDETMSIINNGVALAIEARQIPVLNDTIGMSIKNYRSLQYSFVADLTNFSVPGLQAVLVDRFLNTQTKLSWNSTTKVDFDVDNNNTGSKSSNRFYILFKNDGLLATNFVQVSAARTAEHTSRINWTVGNEQDVKTYTVQKSINGTDFAAIGAVPASAKGKYDLNDEKFTATSYYRIVATDKNGKQQYSNIVMLHYGSVSEQAVRVYPNPVTGRSINIRFTEMPAGVYSLNLFSATGQLLMQKQVMHSNTTATYNIPLGNMASGLYQLQVKGASQNFIKQIKIN